MRRKKIKGSRTKASQPKLPRSGRSKMSRDLETLVGKEVYTTWVAMLKKLVPYGRTHRLSVIVAGMLQYAWGQPRIEKNSVCTIFEEAGDDMDFEETGQALLPVIEQLFKDAGVKWRRTNYKGHGYSIAEESLQEFFNWDLMPWE